jgi:rare lipoprotein A
MHGMTAAHRSLPFGTMVRVVRLDTGDDVVVRINDRGPFVQGRIIDLSYAAAKRIDLVQVGLAQVELYLLE